MQALDVLAGVGAAGQGEQLEPGVDPCLSVLGADVRTRGLAGAGLRLRAYTSAGAHSCLAKAMDIAGLGSDALRRIGQRPDGGIDLAALRDAVAADRRAGLQPFLVAGTAGTVDTGAIDDLGGLAELCAAERLWLHVDGAFGLWAQACPSRVHLTRGVELADSWATDGHKWLQTPYDSGFAIVRDKDALLHAMTNWASYLPTIQQGDRVPSNYVPELSRRARGVPAWAMLKTLGREGVAALVEQHCALARRFAEKLAGEPGIRVLNDVVLNQVIVNFGSGDTNSRKASTEAVIARVQAGGVCYVGGAQWRDDWVMRISVSSAPTTAADIDLSAEAIINAWRQVQKG